MLLFIIQYINIVGKKAKKKEIRNFNQTKKNKGLNYDVKNK